LAPDAPVDVLTGGGGGGGAGVVVCVGVRVEWVVADDPPVDLRVLEEDETDEVRVEPLPDFLVDPGDAAAGAPALAGATPETMAACACRPATVLRRALTCAEFAAMAFCSATT